MSVQNSQSDHSWFLEEFLAFLACCSPLFIFFLTMAAVLRTGLSVLSFLADLCGGVPATLVFLAVRLAPFTRQVWNSSVTKQVFRTFFIGGSSSSSSSSPSSLSSPASSLSLIARGNTNKCFETKRSSKSFAFRSLA